MHCIGTTSGGTEFPSYLHSPRDASGGEVCVYFKCVKCDINVDIWRVCHSSALSCVVEPQVV